jgi:23S rRNA-/tRNA-specific pseudouridylate synthase
LRSPPSVAIAAAASLPGDDLSGAPRLLLHASVLAFAHPGTGEMFEVCSEAHFGLPMIDPS